MNLQAESFSDMLTSALFPRRAEHGALLTR